MPAAVPANERSEAARAAAHASWANTTAHERSARTEAARAAFRQKFLDQANGDPVRAEHMLKAHLSGLRLKAMQAQRRAKEQVDLAVAATAELAAAAEVEDDLR